MEERIIMVSQLEKEFESIVDKKNEPQNEKKPLLIIDDNPEVIEALRVVLNKDYKLLICYSYEEVLQKIDSEINVESLPHSGYLTKGNYDIVELLQTIKQAF